MFTGLIEAVGIVLSLSNGRGPVELEVEADLSEGSLGVGSSIAVNGVCLTITGSRGKRFRAEIGPETIRCTNLGALVAGDRVNLERPLTLDRPLGGHIVQGHVDGVGRVLSFEPEGGTRRLILEVPLELRRYCVPKGSIAIDGISFTIAERRGEEIEMMVIPYTLEHTNMQQRRVGDRVNLEVDILSKYVEGLIHNKPEGERRDASQYDPRGN